MFEYFVSKVKPVVVIPLSVYDFSVADKHIRNVYFSHIFIFSFLYSLLFPSFVF